MVLRRTFPRWPPLGPLYIEGRGQRMVVLCPFRCLVRKTDPKRFITNHGGFVLTMTRRVGIGCTDSARDVGEDLVVPHRIS